MIPLRNTYRSGPLGGSVGSSRIQRVPRRLTVAAAAKQTQHATQTPNNAGASGAAPARIAQRAAAAMCAAALVLAPMPGAPSGLLDPALAADAVKVGTCLLQRCQVSLARCLADGPCAQVGCYMIMHVIAGEHNHWMGNAGALPWQRNACLKGSTQAVAVGGKGACTCTCMFMAVAGHVWSKRLQHGKLTWSC